MRLAVPNACRRSGQPFKLDGVSGDDEIEEPPSRLVRAAADAATVLAGARLGGVGGAVIAAAASPYTEELLTRALAEFRPDVQRRVTQMLGSAAEASEREPDELAELISGSERTRLLTAAAMTAAAGTAWPPKVHALGRALADGLIATDDTEINVADLVVPAMADMERPHVSLLELLVRWIPEETAGTSLSLRPHQDPRLGFPVADWVDWHVGQRIWTFGGMEEARQTLRPVLTSLIGTLQRHGLADQHDHTPQVLAKFSAAMHREANRRGSVGARTRDGTSVLPTITELNARALTPAPSFSPTELGETVLGYYHLAGCEFSDLQHLAFGAE